MRHAVEVCLGLIGSRSRPCPCTAGLTKKNYQMVTRWRRVGPTPVRSADRHRVSLESRSRPEFCRMSIRRKAGEAAARTKTEAPLAPADAAVHSCSQQRIASGRVYRLVIAIICVRHDGRRCHVPRPGMHGEEPPFVPECERGSGGKACRLNV